MEIGGRWGPSKEFGLGETTFKRSRREAASAKSFSSGMRSQIGGRLPVYTPIVVAERGEPDVRNETSMWKRRSNHGEASGGSNKKKTDRKKPKLSVG